MKNLGILLSLVCILAFSACEKENCRNNILGTYTGTGTNTSTFSMNITVNTGNEDKDVILSIDSSTGSLLTLNGTLNSDCTIITIPSQAVASSSSNYSGSLPCNGTSITGNLYSDSFGTAVNCSK